MQVRSMGQFPNPDTQFQKGQSGNAGGKTSAQRKAEIEAAELAALVSRDLVRAVHEAIEGASNEGVQQQIRGDVLTLLRNVQDRAHGTPKQTVETDNTNREAPKGNDMFYAAQGGGSEGQEGE